MGHFLFRCEEIQYKRIQITLGYSSKIQTLYFWKMEKKVLLMESTDTPLRINTKANRLTCGEVQKDRLGAFLGGE